MPAAQYLSKITIPVKINGVVNNIEYTLKDAEARQLIEDLGHAIYWIGVTTTALTDGATTNPITVNEQSVTARLGGMASYEGSEFVWNGTAWQEMGKNNFGALAFKSTASTTYTPAGTVTVSEAADTTASLTPAGTQGTTAFFTVSGETATFDPGTVTTVGSAVSVVTASGTRTATFSGTQATIEVS